MRHDYDLPQAWPGMSDAERTRWLTAERVRRQALQQDTSVARRAKEQLRRLQRRAEARSASLDLEEYR